MSGCGTVADHTHLVMLLVLFGVGAFLFGVRVGMGAE